MVRGSITDLQRGSELDDATEVHHGDAVRDLADDSKVVCDKDVGEVELLLQVGQQVDDLRLDRDVERRDRLVRDHEARVEGQRPCDTDSLALSARELVWVATRMLGSQADELEQLGHSISDLGFGAVAMNLERRGDNRTNLVARVERRRGVLKHDLHVASHASQIFAAEVRDVAASELDRAGIGIEQSEQHAPERRFAAARLADEP